MQKDLLILCEISSPVDIQVTLSSEMLSFFLPAFSHSSCFSFLCSARSLIFLWHLIAIIYFYSKAISYPNFPCIKFFIPISPFTTPMLLLSPKWISVAQSNRLMSLPAYQTFGLRLQKPQTQ